MSEKGSDAVEQALVVDFAIPTNAIRIEPRCQRRSDEMARATGQQPPKLQRRPDPAAGGKFHR